MADTERKVVRWEKRTVAVEEIVQVEGELSFGSEIAPIEQVVATNFYVKDLAVEADEGGARIRGRVLPEILVKTLLDEESPATTPYSVAPMTEGLAFERWFDLPALPANAHVTAKCTVYKSFAERELHHSVKVQVELLTSVMINETQEREVITDVHPVTTTDINVARDVFRTEENLGNYTAETSIQATLDLPYLKSPIARVLWAQAFPSQVRWEVDNGHVRIEGALVVNATYVTSDDQGAEGLPDMAEWGRGSSAAPLHWQVDLDIPKTASSVQLWPTIRCEDIHVENNSNESIRFQAAIKVEMNPTIRWEGDAVVDLASVDTLLDLKKQTIRVDDVIADQISTVNLEKILEMPVGKPDIGRIVGYRISVPRVKGDCIPGKVLVEGNTGLQVIYAASDEERFPGLYTASWEGSSSVEWGETIELAAVDEGMKVDLSGKLQDAIVEVADGKKVRFVQEVNIRCHAVDPRDITIINDWALVPQDIAEGRPSMIFYLTQPGDSYWTIARRYQTTMEALARGNHLALDEPLPMGKRLLIPKSVK